MGPRNPSPRARARDATLCPGGCRSCPGTRRAWLLVKAGVTPSGTQLCTHPQPEGSGVLSPRPRTRCCRSPPPLGTPEPAPYLVPPACFRGSCSHAWPSAGQPVHGLQEGSRVSGQPATQKPCLTGLCRLCCARTVGLGRAGTGLAAGPPQLLTTCPLVRRRLVAASRPCCAGPDPGGTARGCLASVPRPSAAASFELPTPLWSLYMPPEETVSTA